MASRPTTKKMLHDADTAVQHALGIRNMHRKRTYKGHPQREKDIANATDRIHKAMAPIRSELGRTRYRRASPELIADTEKLKEASQALQAERRKLWKLRGKEDERVA